MTKKQIRVMIVEDDEITAYLVEKAFLDRSAMVNWDLCFTKDGEEAINYLFRRGAYAQTRLPQFVLLDWNLPKVHGGDVLRALKSDAALKRIPVLIFSSSRAERDVNAAYDGHANGYVTKPPDIEGLYAVVDSIEEFWVHTAELPETRE